MRRSPGLAMIVLMLAALPVRGQVSGFAETVGFDNNYRPDCWTSMVINLTPETEQSATYQVQVRQEDLDRDRPVFTREITLTGASERAGSRQQKFRMHFIPQPTDGGLPDARDPGSNLKELQDRLKVSLHTTDGKWVCDLPITATVMSVDPKAGSFETRRGNKLILAVTSGTSRPIWRDGAVSGPLLGVMEDVTLIPVQPRDLPENVIGYDAVDSVIWFDADPAELRAGGDERRSALESYIRCGGRLVISQHSDWQKSQAWGELLPVTIREMRDAQRSPLEEIARTAREPRDREPGEAHPWDRVRGPFRIAYAAPRTGALVDRWVTWDADKNEYSPFIARIPVGLGSVTWVAQDLGDTNITSGTKFGWPTIWSAVFDWKSDPLAPLAQTDERLIFPYRPAAGVDIGFSLLSGMDLSSKTVWLLALAIVFFIAYWLLAGPGTFAYLAGRRRTELSWFAFAAAAVAATLVTVLIVQLVLRGPPEMRHFSVVRQARNQPALVTSRMGLYIPRDGYQRIELKDTAPNTVSTISALPWNPNLPLTAPAMQGPEYVVPVMESASSDATAVRIPYSSTLKKLQATWIGELPESGTIEGTPQIIADGFVAGNLTNGTGRKLKNVYIAFRYPTSSDRWDDWMLFVPTWDVGVTIDLAREFNSPYLSTDVRPENAKQPIRGTMTQWQEYWFEPMRGSNQLGDAVRDDSGDRVRRSLPMLSLFDRLPPVRNISNKNDRFELLRRGGRQLDLSGALAAGAVVILAEVDAPGNLPLPFPMEVQGDRVEGQGSIFYQFVLPADRSAHPASTQPNWDQE